MRERRPKKHVRRGFDPELQIPIFRLVFFVYVVGWTLCHELGRVFFFLFCCGWVSGVKNKRMLY